MDKLLKLAEEHGEIFEALTFFKKAMSVISREQTPGQIDDFNKLFRSDVAAHFKFEENQVFPAVLKGADLRVKKIVRDLQRDHIDILEKLDLFQDRASRPASGYEDLDKTAGVAKEIIAMAIKHARKEDTQLFPLVKKLGIKL
ncbi:MAG: hemerythrin domain-containing protein [Candidatus Omnitrophica bacterium]|nr:hemerythrin domain-containing protein [Candidatus Omnitrophota bacterium]